MPDAMKAASIPPVSARLCRRAAALALASAVAFLVANTALWVVPQWSEFGARAQANLQTEPITLTPLVRSLGLGLSSAYVGVIAWALWTARRLFLRLAAGDVFRTETGTLLRRFGLALLLYAGLMPFVTMAMCWIVTMNNPPGQKLLRLGVSDQNVVLALVGTLILVIGSVLADAVRIADENRQII
jgi:hypothetical protein